MMATRAFIARHQLISFFAIAYVLTWLGWILPERIYDGSVLSGVLAAPFLLMVPGPLIAALVVTAVAEGRPGLIALLRKFTIWRVGWGWFAASLLLAPVICIIPAYLNMLFGAPNPTTALV